MSGVPAARRAAATTAAGHNLTCWRTHDGCALSRARDLEINRRELHAGRARSFAAALARLTRRDPPQDLAAVVAAARGVLADQHAAADAERERFAWRFGNLRRGPA